MRSPKYFLIIVAMSIVSLSSIPKLLGQPYTPVFQNIILEGTGSGTHFRLTWTMFPWDTSNVTKFKIYKANYFTNDPANFSYYATINRYGTDTVWSTNVNPVYVGNYSFFITAVRTFASIDLEGPPSNRLQSRFKQGYVDVNFSTIPPTIGSVGKLYQYDAEATSVDPAPVNYVLTSGPQSMSVDAVSGLLEWTPSSRGRYNINLNAYINFNPVGIVYDGKSDGTLSDEIQIDTSECEKDQNWLILVKSCSNPTYFSGFVLNENADTIRSGLVTVYSVNNLDIDSVYYGLIGNNGRYSVEVLEGAYKLSIEGGSFETEWYNNKMSMEAADSSIALCGRDNKLDWIVSKNPPDTITFAYEPNLSEVIGHEYFYNGFAVSSSGRELRYTLADSPQDMQVDQLTGLLNWTPTQIGRFYVSLKAYLPDDSANSFAYKNFYIQVRSCLKETYINGIAKDTSGHIIKQGNIKIYNNNGIDSLGIYFGRIDEDGRYLVKIDEGNCMVFVEGEGFLSQWYDNKSSMDSATSVPCGCGDTTEINLILTRIPPVNLTITSSPSNLVQVGNFYNYNPVVFGNGKRELRFMLIDAPAEMNINVKTGELRWSPVNIGGHKIVLKAYLLTDSANSFVIQKWWLKVKSCPNDTYISGNVNDENSNPVPEGSVRIVSVSGMDSLGYYTGIITNGNYRVLVDEGRCKVYVEGPSFRSEWYENKLSEQTAAMINAPCGETTTANLSVNLFRNYLVSGKVIDELTGIPIENANVYFQSTNSIDSTTTNQSGDYSIDLNEKYSYTSWANAPQNPMYITQYFSLTGNITEFTPVEFSDDINNINFALKSTPPSDNRMTGIVESESGEPIKSIVLNLAIFPVDTSLVSMFDARTYIPDITGTFEFINLAEGDYLLLAIPYTERFAPGYFKLDSIAVPLWENATKVKIVNGEISGPHIIKLPLAVATTGSGRISGIITGDELPEFLKKVDSPQAKEAVSGAVVITVSNDEKVRKYNLTNSIGVYKLDSLGAGDYHVSIDKFGYGQYSFDITIDEDNQSHNVDAELSIQIPVGIKEDFENQTNQFRIYPNPSDGQIIIQSEFDLNKIDISLTNLFGESVNFEKYIINNNTLKFKTNNTAQGLFFLKLIHNGKFYIKPLCIVK